MSKANNYWLDRLSDSLASNRPLNWVLDSKIVLAVFYALVWVFFVIIGLWEHGLMPLWLRLRGWTDLVNVAGHWYGKRREWDEEKGRVEIELRG